MPLEPPAAIPTHTRRTHTNIAPHRAVATQKLTPKDSYQILVEQRRNRPTSPHLAIYRPQITWYSSALNRITGAVLSGGFYVFGATYLLGPLVGFSYSGASMAAAFAAWPLALKIAAKTLVAWPFVFHSVNSLRHLVWDLGKTMTNKSVIRTGWAAAAASVVGTIYLVGFL